MDCPTERINHPLLEEKQIALAIRREDLIHPFISGNKYRKLKYNLLAAHDKGADSILTFGGAYSNHIVATAYAGKEQGFKTIGIIRGDELAHREELNPSLLLAKKLGMKLVFVSRSAYKQKEKAAFLKFLEKEHGPCYLLPEGGTNALAVKGCEEIIQPNDKTYHIICCSVGTGGTIAGLINASSAHQHVLGFAALKGNFLKKDIRRFAIKDNWSLQANYHFGGYARINERLVGFMNDFNKSTGIPLDPVYTAKMLYGIMDLAAKDYFKPGIEILAIHSGGLQGTQGMNELLKKKNLPLINV